MDNRVSGEEVSCYQCGLPVTATYRQHNVDDKEEAFCCAGCFLVHKITGTKGEEGVIHALFGKFGIGLLLTMNVMMLSAPLRGGEYASIIVPATFSTPIKYISLFFSIPVILLLGIPILKSSYESFKNRIIATEALILIGAVSAFLISVKSTITGTGEVYYETATMILTLFTLGRYIDTRARWKASESIKGISSLVPSEVLLLKEDNIKESIPVEQITIGDRVLIRPGDRVPLDGVIISGSGSVDESFLTGESRPVLKEEGMELFSGSINIDASLTVEVRKPADEFVVKKIEKLMQRIRENPSQIKRIGDAIASYFVPFIMALSLGTLIYWIIKGDISTAIMRMLTLLLISCPCAFGLAAPLAVWRGLGEAARRGAIIMGVDIFEGLSRVKTLFFDKTGTLTSHKLTLTAIYTKEGLKEEQLLTIAASLEHHSNHPFAVSLVKEAEKREVPFREAGEVKTRPGLGIEGNFDSKRYYLGSRRWIDTMEITISDELMRNIEEKEHHGSLVFLVEEKVLVAVFEFNQPLREGVLETFEAIKSMKIKTSILTGDGVFGANDIKEKVQPDEIKYRLLPEAKVKEIEMRNREEVVAMVGDGLNDAPALEAAHIGIAMGCGTELTRESAKINLLGDDLRLIPYLIDLSKRVRRKVYINFFWAFFYNVIGICLAINGTITPLFAVIAMLLSSLFVIGNSMRL